MHEVAEQLEHIQSQKLIDRLDEYLEFPEYDPHGDPIPKQNGEIPVSTAQALSKATIGKQYKVVAVKDTSTTFLQQLERYDLQIGSQLSIIERMPYDNSITVKTKKGVTFQLSEKIASNLLAI